MTGFLADTNVWLSLILGSHRHHRSALTWLDGIDEIGAVVIPRQVQMSLLRLLTTAAVLAPHGLDPLTNDQAWSVLDDIADDERVSLYMQEPALEAQWRALSERSTASPKLWMEAYLAAYAIAGDYTLVTLDAAFGQFPGLSWRNLAMS